MKRWTLRIVVFLLLGAIMNVAVAWGVCPNSRIWRSYGGPLAAEDIEWWQATAPAGHDIGAPFRVIHSTGFGCHLVDLYEPRSGPLPGYNCLRKMIGWPMLSLHSTEWSYEHRNFAHRGYAFLFSKAWPCEPFLIGTIVNSVFYGVMLFIPWVGIIAMRRGRQKSKLAVAHRTSRP
jgi:hypothetical protein